MNGDIKKLVEARVNFLFGDSNVVTNYAKECLGTILKYSLVAEYYDDYTLCCNIPIKELEGNEALKKEVLNLLKEDPFEDNNGVQRNWGMEYILEEDEDCMSIRPVVSWS